jgi:hypothetical protein
MREGGGEGKEEEKVMVLTISSRRMRKEIERHLGAN